MGTGRFWKSLAGGLAVAGLLFSGCTEHVQFRQEPAGTETQRTVIERRLIPTVERRGASRIVLGLREEKDVEVKTFSLTKEVEVRRHLQLLDKDSLLIVLTVVGTILFLVLIAQLPDPEDDETSTN